VCVINGTPHRNRPIKEYFTCYSVARLRYVELSISVWKKVSLQRLVFPKQILSNEELLIVLRRQINFYRDQQAAAIDCLAISLIHNSGFDDAFQIGSQMNVWV
jgi:hypothetical protein